MFFFFFVVSLNTFIAHDTISYVICNTCFDVSCNVFAWIVLYVGMIKAREKQDFEPRCNILDIPLYYHGLPPIQLSIQHSISMSLLDLVHIVFGLWKIRDIVQYNILCICCISSAISCCFQNNRVRFMFYNSYTTWYFSTYIIQVSCIRFV